MTRLLDQDRRHNALRVAGGRPSSSGIAVLVAAPAALR
jgi:hypothetical protein